MIINIIINVPLLHFQDKACEEVDMEDVGPTSLDGKKSLSVKQEKLREEAQYEKERVSYMS